MSERHASERQALKREEASERQRETSERQRDASERQELRRSRPPTETYKENVASNRKEITLFILFHGSCIMKPDSSFRSGHKLSVKQIPSDITLSILDNCNPGELSCTRKRQHFPSLTLEESNDMDIITEKIKDTYSHGDRTTEMSNLVQVPNYIEKEYETDIPQLIFDDEFKIINIKSNTPERDITHINDYVKHYIYIIGKLHRSALIQKLIEMKFKVINLYDLSCSRLVDTTGRQVNEDISRPQYRGSTQFFKSTQETDKDALRLQQYFNAKGNIKHKSRKHKSRKYKSRKYKSRKYKSRKHKSRKHKSRKHNKLLLYLF